MHLTVARLKSFEQLMELKHEWHALEATCASSSPFLTWEWCVAWWQSLRESKVGVEDTLDLRCVRTARGQLVAVAPMMITTRPSVGPIRFRQLQFFGADPNITELRGFLWHPERGPEIFRALLQDIRDSSAEWDWALLSGIPSGPTYTSLLESRFRRLTWKPDVHDYVLALPATWEDLRSGLRRNLKESLRKCYNSLKRDGLSFQLEVVRDRAALGPALDHFFRLHRARASLAGTVRHPDVFSSLQARAFLGSVCELLAQRDAVRVFLLRVHGKVAGVRLGFVLQNALYLYFSGYEPSLAKYSVMTTTTAEAIKYAIGERYAFVNLSPGTDASKTRWDPRAVVSREALLVAPNLRGQLMHDLYRRGRHTLDRTPALAMLKRITQRGGPGIHPG